MNEQDLRERMELSVESDLGEPPIDPTADIRRGRTRLRRNRIATGFAAVTSVAAVAALGLQLVPASSADGQSAPPAAQPTTTHPTASSGHVTTTQRLADLTGALLDSTVHRHVDPGRKYTRATTSGVSSTSVIDSSNKLTQVGIIQQWRQSGEVGQLHVSVTNGKQAQSKDEWCGVKSVVTGPLKKTCTTRTAPNGRPIVTATFVPTANGRPVGPDGGLYVRYVRPDGQVVIVSVTRLTKPAVTLQELIAAAIDPGMSLPKK
ncbi:hypothetical protein [Streptomyces sp. SID13031]|uniref:hypothetical protein n=1 Tax=Streptomyces sp. SID13031 TaxID=2706046 RepID=UPI0013C787B9|nr:hypothetical protein [Streptomyces sp. SID13031]NEA33160.1 hypothetical protein [Streptomyces sp. SID13031]